VSPSKAWTSRHTPFFITPSGVVTSGPNTGRHAPFRKAESRVTSRHWPFFITDSPPAIGSTGGGSWG
jgi:hypothetical protein